MRKKYSELNEESKQKIQVRDASSILRRHGYAVLRADIVGNENILMAYERARQESIATQTWRSMHGRN